MTTLRNHCTHEQLLAHSILDGVRAGLDHPLRLIRWALRVLGEKA